MALSLEEARSRLVVALDTAEREQALRLARALRGAVGMVKVGLEAFTAQGPSLVRALGDAGAPVFLDLKLHDIPNTVAGAVRAVCAFGPAARMLTLHCQGGAAMLRAAVEAARAAPQRPLLLGVTVLTSVDQAALRDELGVAAPLAEHVTRLARLAQDCGLDGVVASPHEVAAIRAACGDGLLIVTPGVRPAWAASGDQRRVMTPAAALRAGADYLVIGRPITAPPAEIGGPAAAAARILREIETEAS